jgi:hypothetical protein
MELSKLKVGDVVVTGRIVRGDEASLQIQKVTRITPTQVVLDNSDRYAIDTGAKVGSRLGLRILGLASQADFDREESERQTQEQSRKAIEADVTHREELAALFSEALRPTVLDSSLNQPGQFNLEFYNVPEEDVRKMAELLKPLHARSAAS